MKQFGSSGVLYSRLLKDQPSVICTVYMCVLSMYRNEVARVLLEFGAKSSQQSANGEVVDF